MKLAILLHRFFTNQRRTMYGLKWARQSFRVKQLISHCSHLGNDRWQLWAIWKIQKQAWMCVSIQCFRQANQIWDGRGRTHHEEVTCRFHFDAQVTSQEKGEGMRSNKRLANLLVAAGFLYNLKYKHNKAQWHSVWENVTKREKRVKRCPGWSQLWYLGTA